MAFYSVSNPANFQIINPASQQQQQIENMQSSINSLVLSTPTRLFMNYPETIPDYFNQEPNRISLSKTSLKTQSSIETVIDGTGTGSLDSFSTIPTRVVFRDKTILKGDIMRVNLYIKSTSQNQNISFNMILFESLASFESETGPYNAIYLNNKTIKYPLKYSSQTDEPVLHIFDIPITTNVSSFSPISQLICIPYLHNDSKLTSTVTTYFGGSTPSHISTYLELEELPPSSNTWIYGNLIDEGLLYSTFQIDNDVVPLDFYTIGPNILLMNSEDYYFSDSTNLFKHLEYNNLANQGEFIIPFSYTGAREVSYKLKISDIYDPSNFGIYQIGPLVGGLTGPFGNLVNVFFISPSIMSNGVMNPSRPFSLEITPDYCFTGVDGPFIEPFLLESRSNANSVKNNFNLTRDELITKAKDMLLSQPVKKSIFGTNSEPKLQRVYPIRKPVDEEEGQHMLLAPNFKLPSKVDLRNKMQPIIDQGNIGSCTACSLVAQYGYLSPSFIGSPLFLYYNERYIDYLAGDNNVSIDDGSTISSGIKALSTYGLCSNATWPYITNKFSLEPVTGAYSEGKNHLLATSNKIMNTLTNLKSVLSNGQCFTFGFLVYRSFESASVARTGIVPLPKRGEQVLGGHAVTCVGYDDVKQWFIVRNSWGTSWGDKGYFYMPYSYMTNTKLCWDFWSITKIN